VTGCASRHSWAVPRPRGALFANQTLGIAAGPVMAVPSHPISEKAAAVIRNGRLLYFWPMRKRMNWLNWRAQTLCCVWLAGAQIWYYLQFRSLLRSVIAPLLRRLWHS